MVTTAGAEVFVVDLAEEGGDTYLPEAVDVLLRDEETEEEEDGGGTGLGVADDASEFLLLFSPFLLLMLISIKGLGSYLLLLLLLLLLFAELEEDRLLEDE